MALVGRVHLPVAPRCNIHCRFCERRICAHLTMQHPGWAQRLLSTGEAVDLVDDLARPRPEERFVVDDPINARLDQVDLTSLLQRVAAEGEESA